MLTPCSGGSLRICRARPRTIADSDEDLVRVAVPPQPTEIRRAATHRRNRARARDSPRRVGAVVQRDGPVGAGSRSRRPAPTAGRCAPSRTTNRASRGRSGRVSCARSCRRTATSTRSRRADETSRTRSTRCWRRRTSTWCRSSSCRWRRSASTWTRHRPLLVLDEHNIEYDILKRTAAAGTGAGAAGLQRGELAQAGPRGARRVETVRRRRAHVRARRVRAPG